jgi:hypothetical protein
MPNLNKAGSVNLLARELAGVSKSGALSIEVRPCSDSR